MNWLLLSRMLGLLAMLVGGSMVFSLPWAFPVFGQTDTFETDGFGGLIASILISVGLGGSMYFAGRRERGGILRKEALATVGLGWMLAGLLGALPFLLSGTERHHNGEVVRVDAADAIFESISGFTTTGASVLTHLETPPIAHRAVDQPVGIESAEHPRKLVARCVMFWRCFTHWLGGMGIIVLFVAILGHLGAGGKALMLLEVPGPISETVRPRVRDTAIVMWAIYVGLSVLLTGLLMLEGMTVYDALCHTFGTMATGGFSTWNASVGHYQSATIEWTIIVFMILAGTNFNLYYLMLIAKRSDQKRSGIRTRLAVMGRDPEFRLYIGILSTGTLLLAFNLWQHKLYEAPLEILRHSVFTTVSITTTTGFGTVDFDQWNNFSRALIVLLMFVGGCAGSTGGGIKVVRFLLLGRILGLELEGAFRPNVVRPLRIAGVNLDKSLRHEVIVYFALVLVVFVTSWLLLIAIEPGEPWQHAENDNGQLLDSATAVAATLNNIGPGLGAVGPSMNFSQFAPQSKLLLAMLMLLGRLEMFAILVLFVPSFWKHQ
jgi:trk system potassium uptake protein